MEQETLLRIYTILLAVFFAATVVGWLLFWIARKQIKEKDKEIKDRAEDQAKNAVRALEYRNLIDDDLTNPKTVRELLENLDREPGIGLCSSFDEKDREAAKTSLKTIYQFLFESEFHSFAEKNHAGALPSIVSFREAFLKKEYISKDNHIFWPKLMTYLKASVDMVKNYESLETLFSLAMRWPPLKAWNDEWKHLFEEKAWIFSEHDLAELIQRISDQSSNLDFTCSGIDEYKSIRDNLFEGVSIIDRGLLKEEHAERLKQMFREPVANATDKLKSETYNSDQVRILGEVMECFEKIYRKEEASV